MSSRTETKETTGTWTLDPAHTTVGFSAKHMMFTTVRGRFNQASGRLTVDPAAPEGASLEVEIDAASIDTGVGPRDDHLRSTEFLDVEKHPKLHFRVRRVDGPRLDEGAELRLVGDLTIRDVTREVALDVLYEGKGKDPWGGERMGFTATARIDRRDFGLTWNQALETGGVLVSNEVKIEILAQLQKAAERQAA